VVEVHRYPQDYDVETGQRTAPVVKPQDWEDYDLGVVLKVTPVVDAESNTIDLDLQPEINKFKGFDNYVVGYNAYESGGNNQSELFGDGSALLARMPYFETRTIQTQVTIDDGSTVIMGGLVDERTETFRDQVPFLGDIPYLGRLFRTEGSRSQKKSLVISVKATQVDASGMTRAQRELRRQAAAN
jgi:general secretion pathway protein D